MADKCTVRDGNFLEPCDTLRAACEIGPPPRGKQRGIYWWQLTNMTTGKPSRSFIGAKTTEHPKGLIFNVCPWCGERIDEPFTEPADTALLVDKTAEARRSEVDKTAASRKTAGRVKACTKCGTATDQHHISCANWRPTENAHG